MKKNTIWFIGTLCYIISFGGYLYLANNMALWDYWGALRGLYHFTPSYEEGVQYVWLIIGLYSCYIALAQLLYQAQWRPTPTTLFILSALLALPTIWVYPFNANDIFRYALRGRISAIYNANPYLNPPSDFPTDFFTSLSGEWVNATTPYGPIWELIATAVASALPNNPFWHIIMLKTLSVIAFWLVGWLIWHGLAEKQTAVRLSYTFLWWGNPALLLMFGVDGHNDSLMLLWLVAGWRVWHHGRQHKQIGWLWLGLVLMWLAPLTKIIALLPIPLFAIGAWNALDNYRSRLQLAGATAVSYMLLAWLSFIPFDSFTAYLIRLQSEATAGASFSPAAWLLLWAQENNVPISSAFTQSLNGSLIFFALLLAWLTWWHGRSPNKGAADLFFAYTAHALNFRLWYTTWLFPFLLLDGVDKQETEGHRWRLHVGLFFLLCGQLVVFVYSHLWHELDKNSLATHERGIPLVFIVPLILGSISYGLCRLWPSTARPSHTENRA